MYTVVVKKNQSGRRCSVGTLSRSMPVDAVSVTGRPSESESRPPVRTAL